MEARRLGKEILALPKEDRRAAIDKWPTQYREIIEHEIKWLYDQRKQRASGSTTGAGTVAPSRV
jgi:hypothetical protein